MIKINANIPTKKDNTNFTSALTKAETAVYIKVNKAAKKICGLEDDFTQLIVDAASIPQAANENTGIGKLKSKGTLIILDALRDLLDLKAKKLLPLGKYENYGNFFCPYLRSSALSSGIHNINLKELATLKYGNLVDIKDFKKLVKQNITKEERRNALLDKNFITKADDIVNYENELVREIVDPADKIIIQDILNKAFQTFNKKVSKNADEVKKLNVEFELYKQSRLEINGKKLDNSKRFKAIEEGKTKEQFQFEQFIIDKQFFEIKKEINKRGIELTGDFAIGNSNEEIKAFSDAFLPNSEAGGSWGLQSLDLNKLFDETAVDGLGPAGKYLKMKLKFYMERYDRIRFDVGSFYAKPKIYVNGEEIKAPVVGDKILTKIIEKTAKEMNFDKEKLSYEFGDDLFKWTDDSVNYDNLFKGRKVIFSTEYEHNNKLGWASVDFFTKLGIKNNERILHVGNHDSNGIRQIAEDKFIIRGKQEDELTGKKGEAKFEMLHNYLFNDSISVLSKEFKISPEILNNPKEFVKYKFAELYSNGNLNRSFNLFDILGKKVRINAQNNDYGSFRLKYKENIEEQYHKALQEGHGFNLMESLEIIMKHQELDKKEPNLFKQVVGFARKLREEGPLTQAEAEELAKKKTSSTENIILDDKNNQSKHKIFAGIAGLGFIATTVVFVAKTIKNKNKLKENY